LNLNTDTSTELEKIPNEEPQNLNYLPNNITVTKSGMTRGAQIFRTFGSNLNILGARKLTSSQFHTVGPNTLDTNVPNLVAKVTRCSGFLHPSGKQCRETSIT